MYLVATLEASGGVYVPCSHSRCKVTIVLNVHRNHKAY